jgi:hypothetical protein
MSKKLSEDEIEALFETESRIAFEKLKKDEQSKLDPEVYEKRFRDNMKKARDKYERLKVGLAKEELASSKIVNALDFVDKKEELAEQKNLKKMINYKEELDKLHEDNIKKIDKLSEDLKKETKKVNDKTHWEMENREKLAVKYMKKKRRERLFKKYIKPILLWLDKKKRAFLEWFEEYILPIIKKIVKGYKMLMGLG